MKLSPDQTIFWEYGFFSINLTLVTTWGIMLLLVLASILITRKLKTDMQISRWQCFLEMLVTGINQQIEEVGLKKPEQYIGFIGTLFLFIATSNLLIIIPWYEPQPAHFPPRPRWPSPCFLPCPILALSKAASWGIYDPTSNRPLSCCPSTSLAKYPVRSH